MNFILTPFFWVLGACAGHLLIETALVLTIAFLLMQRSYKPEKKLTEKVLLFTLLRTYVYLRPSRAAADA